MEYSVLLFFSTNHAIWAADMLKKKGYECRMIPVPRHLSSECGYSVKIRSCDAAAISSVLVSAGVEFDRVEKLDI